MSIKQRMAELKAQGLLGTVSNVAPVEGASLSFSMESLDGLQVSSTTESELLVRDLEQLNGYMAGIGKMRARIADTKETGGLTAVEAVAMMDSLEIIDANIGIIAEATKDAAYPSQESFNAEGGQLKATDDLDATMESASLLAATVAAALVASIIKLGAKFYKQHFSLIKSVTKRIAELTDKAEAAQGDPKAEEVKIADGTFLFAGDAEYPLKDMIAYVKNATTNIDAGTEAVVAIRKLIKEANPNKLEELNAAIEAEYDKMFDALRKAFGVPGNGKPEKESKTLTLEASDLLPGGRLVVIGTPAEGSKYVGTFEMQIQKQDKHKTVPALTGDETKAKVALLSELLAAHAEFVKQGDKSVKILDDEGGLEAFPEMVKKYEGKKSAAFETAVDNYNNVLELSWMFSRPYEKLATLVTKVMNGHANQCQASIKNLVVADPAAE